MNNLLNFLVKHVSWFVFIFYVIMSCVLLFNNNPYQQSVYLTSANGLSATVYKAYSTVTSYFNLRTINDELQQRNAALEMQVIGLEKQVDNLKIQLPDTNGVQPLLRQYNYVVANVISNSVSQPYNYITIDRGALDGIEPEMGVVDHNGVVGIVNAVGRHSARIISLLNPYMRLSCKVKRNNYFGSMMWDGRNPEYATLQELPKQGHYLKGDTVVTSGYSAVFPEGIIVGYVVSKERDMSGTFVSLKVRLATNFMQLSTVRAVKNKMKVELKALESKDENKQAAEQQKAQDATKRKLDRAAAQAAQARKGRKEAKRP